MQIALIVFIARYFMFLFILICITNQSHDSFLVQFELFSHVTLSLSSITTDFKHMEEHLWHHGPIVQ